VPATTSSAKQDRTTQDGRHEETGQDDPKRPPPVWSSATSGPLRVLGIDGVDVSPLRGGVLEHQVEEAAQGRMELVEVELRVRVGSGRGGRVAE
jgi:hypothetical protein